jgi:surface antigen
MNISQSSTKAATLKGQIARSEGLFARTRKKFVRTVSQRRFIRYSLLALNVALLGGIIWFVAQSTPSANTQRVSSSLSSAPSDPLDQLSSADIALKLAVMTNLPETSALIEQADTVATQLAVPAAQTNVIAKPQIVATALKSRADIQTYKVEKGDTIASIAAKFGVTSDSVRWSNDITGDTVSAGRVLLIPPVNGIIYTVQSGDTPENLAQKYRANKEQIIAYNDAELTGLKVGEKIMIPNGQKPAPARNYYYASLSFSYGYNGYDYGFCTWYVANRRSDIGRPVPAGLGNASSWDDRAPAAGFVVDRNPTYGAAVVTSQGGAGHVAFVERVNDDGSIWISEMNSRGQVSITDTRSAGGWGRVDYKYVSAAQARSYNYIH